MAIISLQKGSGKRSRVREKSVKSQGILIRIMSGNPVKAVPRLICCAIILFSLNLNLNSLLVKRQIDNPSPGAVTGGN